MKHLQGFYDVRLRYKIWLFMGTWRVVNIQEKLQLQTMQPMLETIPPRVVLFWLLL